MMCVAWGWMHSSFPWQCGVGMGQGLASVYLVCKVQGFCWSYTGIWYGSQFGCNFEAGPFCGGM